jgi:YD repeat-containing protein
MRTTKRALLVLTAVVLTFGVIPALAQGPGIAEGQLLKVDANARTVAIRTAEGTQMQFTYTEDTKVTGAGESVSGLATMAGTEVTVHFIKKQQDNVATQIEVRKKS